MKKNLDLTNGNIIIVYILFALPLFLSSLFQLLYGTVDLLFVGNCIGKTAAAAVGASSILVTCLIGLFTGISVGISVVISQQWGSGKDIKVSIMNALLLSISGGIVLSIAGQFIAKPVLYLLDTPQEIMLDALRYVHVYLISIMPMIICNVCAGIARAMGDSRTPFFVLATGGILNVFMDALFIAVLDLGVFGAALATLVSQVFTAVWMIVYVFGHEHLLKGKWIWNWSIVSRFLGVGIPLGVQSMILTVSNMFVQYYINGFGEDAIAAFTVYFKIENIIYLPILAFGQTMVTFTGQNIGADKRG